MAETISRVEALKKHSNQSEAPLRPVITYSNGDVSWLVSFPRPTSEKSTKDKMYYHAVIDPWFGQPAVLLNSLLLEMGLGRDPGLSTRAEIDAAIVEIELAAGNSLIPTDGNPAVDGIFVLSIAEHCHKESLLQFSTVTPVFAVSAAASTISAWGYFNTVVTMASCDLSKTAWEDAHLGSQLPTWLTVFPPATTSITNFGLVLITSANKHENEAILMAPHGFSAKESSIQVLATGVKMLALVAPLKDSYSFGMKTILGVEDGLAIAQTTGTPYYVRSGDFVSLKYNGVIGWFVNDVPRDLQWGVDQLSKKCNAVEVTKKPILVEVENGVSFVLV
jgi:hypothetical protein